jgi:hypothetical protein
MDEFHMNLHEFKLAFGCASYYARNLLDQCMSPSHSERRLQTEKSSRKWCSGGHGLYGPGKDEIVKGWGKLHDQDLHDVYFCCNIVVAIKRERRAADVVRAAKTRRACTVLRRARREEAWGQSLNDELLCTRWCTFWFQQSWDFLDKCNNYQLLRKVLYHSDLGTVLFQPISISANTWCVPTKFHKSQKPHIWWRIVCFAVEAETVHEIIGIHVLIFLEKSTA